jgi:hypothetical protein
MDPGSLSFQTILGPGPSGFWERIAPDAGPYPETYHLGTSQDRSGVIRWSRRQNGR